MASEVKLRSTTSLAIGIGTVAFAVVALASMVVGRDWDALLRLGAPAALLGLLGWEAFGVAHVELSDAGVTLHNVLRSVRVPWPAIHGVEGRYGLQLDTAYGKLTAWGAPAPSGRDRREGNPSAAAAAVIARLEELRASGHLDNPRLELDRPEVTWHIVPLVATCVLVTLGLVGALVA